MKEIILITVVLIILLIQKLRINRLNKTVDHKNALIHVLRHRLGDRQDTTTGIKSQIEAWIDVNDEPPEQGGSVLVKVPKMGTDGSTLVMIAKLGAKNEWYSSFPYDQPVNPIQWCYAISLIQLQ